MILQSIPRAEAHKVSLPLFSPKYTAAENNMDLIFHPFIRVSSGHFHASHLPPQLCNETVSGPHTLLQDLSYTAY